MALEASRYSTYSEQLELYAEFYLGTNLQECEDTAANCAQRVEQAFNYFKKSVESDKIATDRLVHQK